MLLTLDRKYNITPFIWFIFYFIYTKCRLEHNLVKGKSGMIEIQTGQQPSITRAKSGNLIVVCITLILITYNFVPS